MAKGKILKDDMVVVIAGNAKGSSSDPTVGRVLKVLKAESRVLVEKVNMVRRSVKPVGDQPGGIVEKESAIHISNVALWDEEAKERLRAAWTVNADGKKVRINRKTGAELGGK